MDNFEEDKSFMASKTQESTPRRQSYNEQMLEIVFEMVNKELESNQKVLTTVCKEISENFSEVCKAVKVVTDNVDRIQTSQKLIMDKQEELQKVQTEIIDSLKTFKMETGGRLYILENKCASNIESNLPPSTLHFENYESEAKEASLPSDINLKWGAVSLIPRNEITASPLNKTYNGTQNTKSDIFVNMGKPLSSTPKIQDNNTYSQSEGKDQETRKIDTSELHFKDKAMGTLKTTPTSPKKSDSSHIKMRPVHYDGTDDWEEYLSQFEILSDINKWGDNEKGLYLASSLKGAARSILSDLNENERRDFSKLKLSLARKFGSEYKAEMYRAKLQSRFRSKTESISELATSIMKLTRQAYPKANTQLLDTLAVDYFIDALDDSDIRLRLRQSQPDTITQAETLAIRLETFKTADKVKHRTVCLSTQKDKLETVDDSEKSGVKNELMPVLESFMNKITNDVNQIKSKIDSNQGNKNQTGRKFYKSKPNNQNQNGFPLNKNQNAMQTENKADKPQEHKRSQPPTNPKNEGNMDLSGQGVGTRQKGI